MINILEVHKIDFIVQDLFLLENQLPFEVLELSFERANFKVGLPMEKTVKKFVTKTERAEAWISEKELEELDEEPPHLLHLLQRVLLGGSKKIGNQEDQGFCCLNLRSFQNIKELKAIGIHLKWSRTNFLTYILWLPRTSQNNH